MTKKTDIYVIMVEFPNGESNSVIAFNKCLDAMVFLELKGERIDWTCKGDDGLVYKIRTITLM